MSYLEIKIPHELEQEEAMRRVKDKLESLKNIYGDKVNNLSEERDIHAGTISFHTMGFKITINLYVGVDLVRLSSRLPFFLSVYRKKIESVISQQGRELLASRRKAA